MEWLTANWLWILVFIAFVGMHMFGHGGHAGHGGHGGAGSKHGADDAQKDSPQPNDTAAPPGGHSH